MRIRSRSSERLEVRDVPWDSWAFGVAFAVAGVFAALMMWQTTTLTCLRPPVPEPGCVLVSEGLRDSNTTFVSLEELDSATVAVRTDSDGVPLYRVELATARGRVPLISIWNGDPSPSEGVRHEINAFIGDPTQPSLETTQSFRWAGLLFGGIFVGGGAMVALGFGRVVTAEFSVPDDRVRIMSRGLFGQTMREYPLRDVVGTRVQISSSRGSGSRAGSWRVVLVLRNGSEVPLRKVYRRGFRAKKRKEHLAEQIGAFVRGAHAQRREGDVAPPSTAVGARTVSGSETAAAAATPVSAATPASAASFGAIPGLSRADGATRPVIAAAAGIGPSPPAPKNLPFGMRIRDNAPGRLEIRSMPWIAWLGGGFFAAVGLLLFAVLWETTSLECARPPAPDAGCLLETRRVAGSDRTSIPLEEVDSARVSERVGRDSDGNREVTFRLELVTVDGAVLPFTEAWSSTRFGRDASRNRINAYLRDPGRAGLSESEGSRGRALFVGGMAFGPGLLMLLAFGGITTVVCSVAENRVYTKRRGIFGVKKTVDQPLDRLKGAVVQKSSNEDGGQAATYRVALVLRDGSEVPLTLVYSSGLAEKMLVASRISEFADALPGQVRSRPSLRG